MPCPEFRGQGISKSWEFCELEIVGTNVVDRWTLTPDDHVVVMTKSRANRLGFALLLLFYRTQGRFPNTPKEIEPSIVDLVARQLGIADTSHDGFDTASRTWKRHRAEIRALSGFRESTVADAEMLSEWLRDHAGSAACVHENLVALLYARCRELLIEPPTADRIDRIVRTAILAHEERFYASIYNRLTLTVRAGLDALLRPAKNNDKSTEAKDVPGVAPAVLHQLRSDPGQPSLASVQDELAKLELICRLDLPSDLFNHARPHDLERYRQRVVVEAPYELRRHPEATRLTWLAAFAHLRGRSLTDNLVDLLIEPIHHIGARAERKVERELLEDLKRVTGKQNLLFGLANATLDQPDGIVREVVFPVASEEILQDLVKEWKATGPTYRTTLRTVIRNSYKGHYRRMVPQVLQILEFRSNNERHRPVIRALDLIKRYAGSKLRTFPAGEEAPLDGVVRGLWREAVIEQNAQGRQCINRITYEICVLEALRDQLRCKEIWVVGANRYRNPDEDLPADFGAQRTPYYEALNLPLDSECFIADLRISKKRGGWIALTPLDAQPEPPNLNALKNEITATWPMTSLLDMVKEADLRLNFTDALKSPTAYETLDRSVLQPRLLLCLHGLGTNAGLQRMAGHQSGMTHKDLAYVRHRYVGLDALRRAIAIVTNGTLHTRDPVIWQRHDSLRVRFQALQLLGSESDDAVARSLWRPRYHDLLACRTKIVVHSFPTQIAIIL